MNQRIDINTGASRVEPGIGLKDAPSLAMDFLARAAPIAVGAAICAGIAAVSLRLDAATNSDIVAAIQENWHWSRVFTTSHSLAALAQMYPGAVEGTVAVIGAGLAAAERVVMRGYQ